LRHGATLPIALLVCLPCAPPPAVAADTPAAVFHRLDPAAIAGVAGPQAVRASAVAGDGSDSAVLGVDAAAMRAFRAAGGGRLDLPVATGDTIALDLAPYDLFAGASPTVTDEHGGHAFQPDVRLFRGRVIGEPESWAVIAMGAAGVFGALERHGERWNLGPAARATGALPSHVLARERVRAAATPFHCDVDAATPDAAPWRAPTRATALNAPRTVWRVAVDCDYEVLHDKFGDDLTAATSYALTVLGTVSLIYERDLAATLTVPFLNFWATPADPYSAATPGSQLTQFAGYWITNHAGVQRSAAFLMSGRPLGGGIANIASLCDNNAGYALAAMDFVYAYPTATTTWDVSVVAHELGHVFGSWHTQSCNWSAQGYLPASTTIDSCFASEGGCATYTTHLPPDKGTIMSYCHLVAGVADGLRLEFHPLCVQRMRTVMAAAGCGPLAGVQPPQNLAATPVAGGVRLTWGASPTSGVLGYEVCRSHDPLDAHPVRLGLTAALQLEDPGLGAAYYRVRALQVADTSAATAEVKATSPCGLATGAPNAAGATPVAAIAGDWNGDGREDLLVARQGDNALGLHLGQGSGGVGNGAFAPASTTATAPAPACVASDDVTGDGIADLVVGCGTTLRLHRGNATAGVPNGTFAPGTQIGSLPLPPRALAIADLDENGADDIVVLSGSILLRFSGQQSNGVPTGTFAVPKTIALGMNGADLAIHDFDSDGVLDLAVSGDAGIALFRGHGTAGHADTTFDAPVFYPGGASPGRMAMADLDGDGAEDLVVCDAGDTLVRVFRGRLTAGKPDGTFAPGVAYGAGPAPAAIAIVDWDHDGVPDVVVGADTSPGIVSVLLGRGDGRLLPRFFVPAGGDGVTALVVDDVDEDGSADVLALCRTTGAFTKISATCPGALPTNVVLLSPNGGETWFFNQDHPVTWTRGAGVPSVDLQLSSDGGGHWRTLARELTGTSWPWTVAGPATTHAQLRVVAHGFPQSTDKSNADFTMVPASSTGVGDAPPATALLGIRPNPARGSVGIAFSIPAGASGRLSLVDLPGRRVAAADVAPGGGGERHVAFALPRNLPAGVYLVRLESAGILRTAKVAVVR